MKRFRIILLVVFIVCLLTSAVTFGILKYRESSGISVVPVSDSKEGISKLPVDLMREDLDYLVNTLEKTHPSTVKGFDENQKKIIKDAYDKINGQLNSDDFYFIANEIVASINDGHTLLNNAPGMKNIRLPFTWLSEGMIVNSNTDKLKKGDKILSIGGKTEKQLYEYADKLIPGENQYWKKDRAQSGLIMEPVLRHFNLINGDSNVDIDIERAGTVFKVSLPLISESGSGETEEWVRWNIEKENSLGILHLDRCVNDDKYKQTVNDFFKAVKENNVKNVALDLRRNTGGDSTVINIFLQYLNIDTYKGLGSEVRMSQSAKDQRDTNRSTPLGYYKNDSMLIKNKKIAETDLIYEGKIYVLTSARTFSSANLFTLTLKDNGLAKVLGEPTGNATTRYGDLLKFTLPNSKMNLGVSYKIWKRPDARAGWQDAVYPDIDAYTTRDDITNGKDPQLEKLRLECAKNN